MRWTSELTILRKKSPRKVSLAVSLLVPVVIFLWSFSCVTLSTKKKKKEIIPSVGIRRTEAHLGATPPPSVPAEWTFSVTSVCPRSFPPARKSDQHSDLLTRNARRRLAPYVWPDSFLRPFFNLKTNFTGEDHKIISSLKLEADVEGFFALFLM